MIEPVEKRAPRRVRKALLIALLALLVAPFLIPENARIPVQGASVRDWNPRAFWYEPWGASGVHKGIDIFAPQGRPVIAPVHGIVIYRGSLRLGGNVVAVLGPKWRLHYFAHLRESNVHMFEPVGRGDTLGSVGTTGNAVGKAPHLHYAVLSLLPRPWKATGQTQGWKKMFFVDPGRLVTGGATRLLEKTT
jgi:murein DD-endopeptidase MepM/ murein hydrolase activator NlpD